ncbi:DUF6114 domain-containing protein [Nocardiopsis sp. LOL_012]|uniref:DUF6114 domain-containing protein n=1 Tax=Nocardiopsis sp. LOL_012 TaxID=3345409 RepID=UPI003A8411B3
MLSRMRDWRKRRPFAGGLLMVLAGLEMAAIPLAPIDVMIQLGLAGVPTLLISGMLVVLGLITWFTPNQNLVTGSLAGFLGLGALVISNLGGFVIGTLLALVGGALAFAWRPTAKPARESRRDRRQRTAKTADSTG